MGPPAFSPLFLSFLFSQTAPPDEGRTPLPWSPSLPSIPSLLLPPLAPAKKYSPRMAWPPSPFPWMTSTRIPRATTLQPRVKNVKPSTAFAVFAHNPACGPDTMKPCKL